MSKNASSMLGIDGQINESDRDISNDEFFLSLTLCVSINLKYDEKKTIRIILQEAYKNKITYQLHTYLMILSHQKALKKIHCLEN